MSDKFLVGESDALLVVDLQNDFCRGGALAVPCAEEVIPIVNRLAAGFGQVILTQDWHPPDHISFASTHPGRQPFDRIELPYGLQELWPDHCVQGTRGADFHADLHIRHAELILRKGYRRDIDSYSIFFENDRKTPTGLGGYLRERGLTRVFLAGLALDFCVRFSAEDARRMGFETIVVEDACRAIDSNDSLAAAKESFAFHRIPRISSRAVEGRKAA
jgi:nicotinamidase/pyrazinamidase